MKFIIVLACLAIFVATTQAQVSTTTTEAGPVDPNPGSTTTARTGPVTASPGNTCTGQVQPPATPACQGRRNEGSNRGRGCAANANPRMWHFNEQRRECQAMMYRGCGGNNNRHCTKAACDALCGRR